MTLAGSSSSATWPAACPCGLLARPAVQARGHPDASAAGTSARRTSGGPTAAGSACRSSCSTSLKGFVPALLGDALVCRPPRRRARRRARRCSATGGRSSCGFAKGGKMVATCGGAFLGVAPLVGLIGALVWLAVFALFRYASVASIVAGALAADRRRVAAGEPWPVIVFALGRRRSACSSCTARTSAACGRAPRRRVHAAPQARRAASNVCQAQLRASQSSELGVALERAAALELARAARRPCRSARRRRRACGSSRGSPAARAGSRRRRARGSASSAPLAARSAPSPRRSAAAGARARRRTARRAASAARRPASSSSPRRSRRAARR